MRLPSVHLPRRHRSVLGMDIGADGVRLIEIHAQGDGFVVDWADEISLTELQGFADYDSVAEKLQQVLAPRLKHRVEVATVPPWNSARTVIEEMPAMEAAQFQQAAHWYFENHPQEDMLNPVNRGIPQTPRTTIDDKHLIDGIMVSLDQVMFTGLADMCQRLDLKLNWLFPTPLCFPALLRNRGEGDAHTLFVDVGANQSRMALSNEGIVRLVRKLKPAANDIVRDLGDSEQIGWVHANQALLAHSGLGPLAENDDEGIAARARDAVDRGLDRLAESLRGEILRSAAYVEARHGERVERVLLGGGLGGAPGLIERLEPELGFPLESIDPFHDDVGVPVAARPRYALAAGAAILALERREDSNLLLAERAPATERRRATTRKVFPARRIAAATAAVAVVGGLIAYDVSQQRAIARAEEARTRLEEEHIALKVRARELTAQEDLFEIEGRVEGLRGIYQSRRLFTPFFTQVVGCLPDEARLDHASIQRGARASESAEGPAPLTVALRGRTRDVDAVGGFVVSLEQRGLLSRIEVLRINERTQDEAKAHADKWFEFELRGEPVVMRQDEFIAANAVDEDTAPEVAR